MKYAKVYYDMTETVDELSDAEAGRLFKAILKYGSTGAMIQLPGQERIIFGMVRAQLDRDGERYEAKAAINRINGLRGGRPSYETQTSSSGKTQNNPLGSEITQNNPLGSVGLHNERQRQRLLSPLPPTGGDDNDGFLTENEMASLGEQYDTLMDAIKRVGLVTQRDAEVAEALMGEYGLQPVLGAIQAASESNVNNWRYIRAVLKGKPREEDKPVKFYDFDAPLR